MIKKMILVAVTVFGLIACGGDDATATASGSASGSATASASPSKSN